MDIKCYGWHEGTFDGIIKPDLPIWSHLVPTIGQEVECNQNCRTCLFDLIGDTTIYCPGLRGDGDSHFAFTLVTAQRKGDTVSCDFPANERKCPVCLLKLRRKKTGR
ncbi:MAG: hypothetical protein WC784_03450 [Candidatus Shapirobacteria bacterium]|jgi:hypothetical protein